MFPLLFLIHCAWSVTISNLLVENLPNPVGISVTNRPRFSWTLLDLSSTLRGQSQSAYQIQVCSSAVCQTADIWDSGKVSGSQPFLNQYGGNALKPATKYFWKVRVWDQTGAVTPYSQIGYFVTSISDFSGSTWITGGYSANQYRTEFTVPAGTVQSAFVHVVGLGYFDFQVNGQRVNDHHLSPGWTDYGKRSYSVTYDLSSFINTATKNAIGITLGNSWFSCAGGQPGCVNSPPQLLVAGSIVTSQGQVYLNTTLTNTWKVHSGPVTYNSLYNGENYDARLETQGWTMPGFDDSQWTTPSKGGVAPETISPQVFEPIRKLNRFSPRTISQPFQGVYVVDFGQNMAGLVSITIRNCVRGQNITLRHAELLTHPPYGPVDGSIYVGNLRSARATDVYTCKGSPDGVERYSPRFTQHGFKYVEVTGLSQILVENDITADELHTDVQEIGDITSPLDLINKIQHNTVWGQKSNLMSVPTDCPQRDERRGWMGDAGLTSEECLLNFEVSAFYTAWLDIIRDDQRADGSVNNFVPNVGDSSSGAPNWQTAYPTLIWSLLKYRGDTGIVKNHWTSLQRYLAFFNDQYKRTGLKNFFTGFGDWVPPPPQPMANNHLVAAFSYCRDLMLFADFALALEDHDLHASLQTQLGALKDEFNDAFFNSKTNNYGSGLQTENAMGLWLGFAPDTQVVLNNLIADITMTHTGHPTTGILGWKFMLEVLSKYGRGDVALRMNLVDTYPSIGFMIQGAGNPEPATTIWELWDSYAEGPGMNSRNHIMFGTVGSWLYKGLIGFDVSSTRPGVVAVGVDSAVVGVANLTSVTAQTRVPYGDLSVSWWIDDAAHTCQWDPENSNVRISCPDSTVTSISAFYGTPAGDCSGFKPGKCNSPNAQAKVEALCLGKSTCQFVANNNFFGGDPCVNTPKTFAVKYTCANTVQPFHQSVSVPFGQAANINIPIVGSMGQDLSNLVVSESGKVVWQNGKYVPGVSGISTATVNPSKNGVVFQVGSGKYKFDSYGQR